ncbi:MAG: hypothetical protein ACRERC_08335 [Candidatus Binatia bacterium]
MTPSATATFTRTASQTVTATRSLTPTRTATATASATPSATATPGLGVRRFSLDPTTSTFALLPVVPAATGFSGYLDLAAGVPDPATGLAVVAITGASEFLSIPVGDLTLCIRPLLPVERAGVLACSGGVDLGVSSSQDHNVGVVGVDGFTADECAAQGGLVEVTPHPGVCNGPVGLLASPEPDSGVGALLLAPDPRFDAHGLPAEISFAAGPCSAHGPGAPTAFGFVSGAARAEIANANNEPGELLTHQAEGENFSCAAWMTEDGPGRLVLAVPAVHGAGAFDAITVIVLDD